MDRAGARAAAVRALFDDEVFAEDLARYSGARGEVIATSARREFEAHGVPRSELWSCLRLARDGTELEGRRRGFARRRGVKQAGVERDFYRHRRPDGTYAQDVEDTLARFESQALPVLRDLGSDWPPDRTARATLAQFLALQLVRGRGWREWHDQFVGREVEEWRRTREPVLPGAPVPTHADVEAVGKALLGDAGRMVKMLDLVPKVATLLGHMHWTLLQFGGTAWRRATRRSSPGPWPSGSASRASSRGRQASERWSRSASPSLPVLPY